MKYLFVIAFVTLSFLCKAQYNLVPNPSFEIYSNCPNSASQLIFANPWTSPTNNDGDYFNSCATNINYSVPNQGIYNHQNAHSGSAYVGIFMYNGVNNNYREYCSVQLINSMLAGKCYLVSFYVNKSSGFYGKYAVNNIAGALTASYISNTGTGFVLNLSPSILKYNNPIIVDTLNWVQIAGIYVANGGEAYLTIGNFKDDASTDTLDTGQGNYAGAGYLIDDVSVIPIDSVIGGMTAFAGIDKSIALGDSTFIGQEISNLNCNWFELSSNTQIATNISGVYVKPNVTTNYLVEQNLCGVITYDTVKVSVTPTGIKQNAELQNSISVYPNPNNGNFKVKFSEREKLPKKLSIIIYNSLGQSVIQIAKIINYTDTDFDILESNLQSGFYTIKIFDADLLLENLKLIIE